MPERLTIGLLERAAKIAEEEKELIETAAASALTDDDVLMLLAELGRRQAELRQVMSKVASRSGLPRGARPRLLRYLQLTRGKIVDKDELSGVSGIHEWARRLRELRLDDGWAIVSHEGRTDLKPGQYRLESTRPRSLSR